MDSRSRAKEYDQKLKSRTKKGHTDTKFGKVGRDIDAESEKPRLRQQKFVSGAKTVEEQRAEESADVRQDLDKIEKDEDKELDRGDFKQEEAKPVVRPAPARTMAKQVDEYTTAGAFAKAWTISDHVTVPEVIEPKKSSYYPNFIAGSIIVEAIEHCLDGVEELKWISPNYFSLPARIYWCVLFYIQILKAKEAAGKLLKSESTWFRAFKRVFPLESLPVAGPLVPFYTNITAVKPNDDMYDFVYPDFPKALGLTVTAGVPHIDDAFYLMPNVLLLAELLRMFTTLTTSRLNEVITPGNLRFFDREGNFIPNRIGESFTFAGIDYAPALTAATSSTLSNLGFDKALPEGLTQLYRILPYWRRAKARDIPAAGPDEPFNTIGDALRMADDFEWFEDCVEMATTQCKFFTDSINMSQIPATGGSEVLLAAHVTGKKPEYKGAKEWLPRNWASLKSQFRTTRADTTTEQIFNSAYALTTATISWTANGHPIGGRQAGHRTGPYWENKRFQFEQSSDIEVQRRTLTMIRSQFFEAHGDAS